VPAILLTPDEKSAQKVNSLPNGFG
jgi:hypothetical protein